MGEGTVPLAIVIYIDGSFIKHSIPVKPIYITVRNLDSVVSGKAMAWRVLGMLPSFKKSATPNESDDWRRHRRLDMHHACIKHIVDSINNFREKDVHVQCPLSRWSGKSWLSLLLLVYTVLTRDILVHQQVRG